MGIIARQAFWNSISIVVATLLGAVNTIIVLPRAFAGFEEGWGLLVLFITGGMVYAPFLSFSSSNIIIRFYEYYVQKGKSASFLSFVLSLPLLGVLLFSIALFFLGGDIVGWMAKREEDVILLEKYVLPFFILTLSWTGFQVMGGYVCAILKTSFFQLLNEIGVKGLYFVLALLYWAEKIDFDQMVWGYTGIYLLLFALLSIFSLKEGLRINLSWKGVDIREICVYGLYSIMDKGVHILVNRLDIIMIGLLLDDLANIAYYVLAFYIGSVVLIPQKSILVIANPVASKAIQAGDNKTLREVYKKSSLNQLILGGMIFLLIWINIDAIMYLLPEKFHGGKWVVFYIGWSKLFYLMAGVNGGIIVYSKYYRTNLVINSGLLFLTIATNLLFIPQYGITGAALATSITFFLYTLAKIIYVKAKFGIDPYSKAFVLSLGLIILLSVGGYFLPIPGLAPFWEIVVKGSLFALIYGGLVLGLRLSSDIQEMILHVGKRIGVLKK